MRDRVAYDQVTASNSRAVAKVFDIPHTVLQVWQREGFIDRVLVTPEQWEMLNMIRCVIWDNRRVIRAMLANLPKSVRRRLVDDCEKNTIERIVYHDFLRVKLTGRGLMNDGRLITYVHYQRYLSWRHPNLCHLLTRQIFERQRKAAEARIRYCRKMGTLGTLISDLGLQLRDGVIVNPFIQENNPHVGFIGRNIFHD